MEEIVSSDLDIKTCIKTCLKTAYSHVKALTGSKEIVKNLIRNEEISLVILSKDLIKQYQDLILMLCKNNNVPVIFLENKSELAEVFPIKVKKASAIAIKNFIGESREKAFLMNVINN